MLIKYTGKYVNIYFIMKITYYFPFILFVSYVIFIIYVCPGVWLPLLVSRCSDRLSP